MRKLAIAATGVAVGMASAVPAFAQDAATATTTIDGSGATAGVVTAAILGLAGVIGLAAVSIEFAWKGMTKAKQTVKRL